MTTLTARQPDGYDWTLTTSGYLYVSAPIGGHGLYVTSPGSITNSASIVAGTNGATGARYIGARTIDDNAVSNQGTMEGGAAAYDTAYGGAGFVGGAGLPLTDSRTNNGAVLSGVLFAPRVQMA